MRSAAPVVAARDEDDLNDDLLRTHSRSKIFSNTILDNRNSLTVYDEDLRNIFVLSTLVLRVQFETNASFHRYRFIICTLFLFD